MILKVTNLGEIIEKQKNGDSEVRQRKMQRGLK